MQASHPSRLIYKPLFHHADVTHYSLAELMMHREGSWIRISNKLASVGHPIKLQCHRWRLYSSEFKCTVLSTNVLIARHHYRCLTQPESRHYQFQISSTGILWLRGNQLCSQCVERRDMRDKTIFELGFLHYLWVFVMEVTWRTAQLAYR